MAKSSVQQNEGLAARAAVFAVRAHEGQYRKGTGFPYVVHPIGVAHILRDYYPEDEELEAAGYLHDVLEDTEWTEADLRERFGDDITELVIGVTNDGNWRLADYKNNPRVLRLKAADMLDNILDTVRGLDKGHSVWRRFAAGPRKAETWRKHVDLMWKNLDSTGVDLRLIDRLDSVLRKAERSLRE